MKYLLLIYNDERQEQNFPPEKMGELMQRYGALSADLEKRKMMLAGEPLEPTSTATTVRVRNGRTMVTDGPFAETKEQLGGFYMIDAKNIDEALEVAARIPGAEYGCVEVRPVMDLSKLQSG
jgi:hypothetical protein